MRQILLSAAALALPGVAFAHTSIADHAHPHEAGHPYLGIDTLLLVAAVAVAAGAIAYAFRKRPWSGK